MPDGTKNGEADEGLAIKVNALTRAWINVQGLDATAWAHAAALLPNGVWILGGPKLSGYDSSATFRRTGNLIDARVDHAGIGYAMIGVSATVNVSVDWPEIIKDALPGRTLQSVIDTPVTRVEKADIVTSYAFQGSVDRILVVAVAPLQILSR